MTRRKNKRQLAVYGRRLILQKTRFPPVKFFNSLLRRRSSLIQDIYSLYRFRRFVSEFVRTFLNKRKSRKRGEHSASFPSPPKINRMLYRRLLSIQWKFTTPDQLASPGKFCSLRLFFFFGPLKYLNLVFQSNQHFQTKEFMDRPVSEELDNVRSFLFYGHEVL